MVKELAKECIIGHYGEGDLICDAQLNPPFIMVPLDNTQKILGLKNPKHTEAQRAQEATDFIKISLEAFKRI